MSHIGKLVGEDKPEKWDEDLSEADLAILFPKDMEPAPELDNESKQSATLPEQHASNDDNKSNHSSTPPKKHPEPPASNDEKKSNHSSIPPKKKERKKYEINYSELYGGPHLSPKLASSGGRETGVKVHKRHQ
eukprot:gnl/TRDRNA2_/TRDRNA2_173399_c0_seq4.p1 gnl/TRDRNA2_/TRDRNA2_173399_c0~~gnl/TRDRNA2_/TRDRNA2_173399_c0_seq4.p1  ORF type:complete len:156 (+),score=39.02 gnl/TRDRNA2_/TRDRNA2_173399_c0_seq4:71-469(+)